MGWEEDIKYEAEQRQQKGGQHVGTSLTGVWAKHIPSGLVAFCNTERSQHRNREIVKTMIEFALIETGIMNGYLRKGTKP